MLAFLIMYHLLLINKDVMFFKFFYLLIILDSDTFYSKYLLAKTWEARYVETVYYSATTMITVGYGDLSPQNIYEKIICIFFMLFSCI